MADNKTTTNAPAATPETTQPTGPAWAAKLAAFGAKQKARAAERPRSSGGGASGSVFNVIRLLETEGMLSAGAVAARLKMQPKAARSRLREAQAWAATHNRVVVVLADNTGGTGRGQTPRLYGIFAAADSEQMAQVPDEQLVDQIQDQTGLPVLDLIAGGRVIRGERQTLIDAVEGARL